MGELHYMTSGGLAARSVLTDMPVLAFMSYKDTSIGTPTYANQVREGNQVLMTLGGVDALVSSYLIPLIKPDIDSRKAASNQKELEVRLELESLGPEAALNVVGMSTSTRAKPFLDYAWKKGRFGSALHNIRAQISNNSLTSEGVTQLISTVYAILRSKGVTSQFKGKLEDYLVKGRFDDELLSKFEGEIDSALGEPVFKKVWQYNTLQDQLEQLQRAKKQGDSLANLAQALGAEVAFITSGNKSEREMEFEGLNINVYQMLQQLVGTAPEKPFLLGIERLVETENLRGLVAPFRYTQSNGGNIPVELKSHVLSTERMGKVVAFFDRTLMNTMLFYALGSDGVQPLFAELFDGRKGHDPIDVLSGILMRAIFPENHRPILTLYPDSRITLNSKNSGKINELIQLVRSHRAEIPGYIAKKLGLPEQDIRFEELVQLQSQLMQLLPMPIYTCVAIDREIQPMADAKRKLSTYDPGERARILIYDAQEKRLIRDFGITSKKITGQPLAAAEDAINLFGEEFGFAVNIMRDAPAVLQTMQRMPLQR